MATKFLDYTGLSYLWGKIKAWCNATFVHLTTDEDITGTKTFVGSKKIAFKQSGSNDKLGFTLYNNSSKEQGYLEYNPTNKIANVPLFTLGNYATAANELTYIGFRRYSNISGASGAYNLLAPLISDAKTPFNLTTTYTNFYLPLGISDGTNIVKANNSGVIDISSFLTLSGYTKPSTGSALASTDTIIEALGKLEAKVDAVDQSNVVHRTGDETIAGEKTFKYTTTLDVTGNHITHINIRNPLITRGTPVGSDDQKEVYSAISFLDNEGILSSPYSGRLAMIEYVANSVTGHEGFNLHCYDYLSQNTANYTSIGLGYDVDRIPYAIAPETSVSRVDRRDIVTRGFLEDKDYITSSGSITGNAATASKVTGGITASHVGGCVYGNALVNSNVTDYGAIWNAPTKNYRVSMATYPGNNDLVYLLSCTKENVANDVNNMNHFITWDANNGDLKNNGKIIIDRAANVAGGSLCIKGNAINYAISLQDTGVTKGTDLGSTRYIGIDFYGSVYSNYKNRFAILENQVTGTTSKLVMAAYNSTSAETTSSCAISVRVDASGNGFAEAPTPAADANDTRIATTKWVKDRGYLTSQTQLSLTNSGSGNAVTGISVSNHAITVTKGSTFLTSHQSLANYVTLSGEQQITGYKKFIKDMSLINSSYTAGSNISSDQWWSLIGRDTNSYNIGGMWVGVFSSDKHVSTELRAYESDKGGTYAWVAAQNKTDATRSVVVGCGAFYPNSSGTTLGKNNNTNRWGQIYSSSTTISNSDERSKTSIDVIPDEVLDAWENFKFKQFQMKDAVEKKGENARLHTGGIAQEVDRVFKEANLDARRYGMFCWDEWEAEPAEFDESGYERTAAIDAGEIYSLRYEELLCMEAAYQRRKNKILENRISELERQVSDMLQILQSLKGAN